MVQRLHAGASAPRERQTRCKAGAQSLWTSLLERQPGYRTAVGCFTRALEKVAPAQTGRGLYSYEAHPSVDDGRSEGMLRKVILLAAMVAVLSVAVAGVAAAATRIGTQGADELTGTASHDEIYGLGGPDLLRGLEGCDYIVGGLGADTIRGGAGNDHYYACNDDLGGLYGGNGADTIYGGGDADWLDGGAGADVLRGGSGDDYVDGVDGIVGNDFVSGGSGTDDTCYADSEDEIDKSTCEVWDTV